MGFLKMSAVKSVLYSGA